MQTKAPFFVMEEFISPLQCEDIVARLNNTYPNFDINNNPSLTVKANALTESRILPGIKKLLPSVEEHFGFEYSAITHMKMEWYPEGYVAKGIRSDNSYYTRNEWAKINELDFTGVIFLNDYQNKTPFDVNYEVSGGKYEFPTHQFGFLPTRGRLLIHPSGPNFAYSVQSVVAGNLNLIRFHVVADNGYNYNPANFPGSYETWFS